MRRRTTFGKGRVGLVTLHSDNFGSVLQCFATKRHVESLGYACDVLSYVPGRPERMTSKMRVAATIVKHPSYLSARKQMRRAVMVGSSAMSPVSKAKLEAFVTSVLQPRKVDWTLLCDLDFLREYEWFITGSDQVWSGYGLANPFHLLDFSEDDKKIALSASFGSASLQPYNRAHFARSLASFAHLSVREDQGALIVSELIGRNVPVLADPVTFMTKEQWCDFSNAADDRPPYILAHFLDQPSEVAISTVKYLSCETGLPVLLFAYPRKELDETANCKFVDGSPIDYVSLIGGAEYVCTDSFHTSQFAILFDSDFFVFDRMYVHSYSQSSRIETILRKYSCTNRLLRAAPTSMGEYDRGPHEFERTRSIERKLLIAYLDGIIAS